MHEFAVEPHIDLAQCCLNQVEVVDFGLFVFPETVNSFLLFAELLEVALAIVMENLANQVAI